MKKSQEIILSAILLAAITSCDDHHDQWTSGASQSGQVHDTSIYKNGAYHYYRYYGSGWYPISRNNTINVGAYEPASATDIASSTYTPRTASGSIRSGGFGSSAGEGEGSAGE